MTATVRIGKEFTFEAAHFLPSAPEDNHNRRLHGHSFRVVVTVQGHPDHNGLLIHFDELTQICQQHIHAKLDHRFLNEIEGLEQPTLENICIWMWQILRSHLPQLYQVSIFRDSCGEQCHYQGR